MESYKARRNDDSAKNIENNVEAPQKTKRQLRKESTEKAVDLAAETALDVYTGGQFSQIKNNLSKIPLVGEKLNKEWNKKVKLISKVASHTKFGRSAQQLDNMGMLDTARDAKDMYNSVSSGEMPDGTSGGTSGGSKGNNFLGKFSKSGSKKKNFVSMFGNKNKKDNGGSKDISSIWEQLPPALKFKIYAIGIGFFAFIMLFMTVFAEQDEVNMGATNSGSGSSETSAGTSSPGGPLSYSDTASNGNGKIVVGQVLTSEPDPSAALNYWSQYVDSSKFVYPKDKATNLPLGAWPKDYASIPTQITKFKTYHGLMFPLTPMNGTYSWVYDHNGIDIMAPPGTPIYCPVDGTIVYSEWGHTVNKGSDETAYSVTVRLDNPITYNGYSIQHIFMTHMSGIRYRCPQSTCNQKVKQGELIGFVGNAAGNARSVGWAPHLHMTVYSCFNCYGNGLWTDKLEALYGLPRRGKIARKVGE